MGKNEASLSPETLRSHLRAFSDLDLSARGEAMFGLFAGLIATMNMLEPEGYSESLPAFTFEPIKE